MANSESTAESATDTPLSSAEQNRGMALEGIADALHFLDNVQPLVGCDFSGDDEFIAGRSTILNLIEKDLRRHAWPDSPAHQAPTEAPESVDVIIERAFASAFNKAIGARAGDDITLGQATAEFIAAWRRVAEERARAAGVAMGAGAKAN